jgi:hypothetical protein
MVCAKEEEQCHVAVASVLNSDIFCDKTKIPNE